MFLLVHVSPSAAVLAGQSKSGILPVELTSEWLAAQRQTTRDELARYTLITTRSELVSSPTPLDGLDEPTLSQVYLCLQHKIDERAKAKAEEQARQAEREARAVTTVTEWLAAHSDPASLVERSYDAGRGRYRVSSPPYDLRDLPAEHPLLAAVTSLRSRAEPLAAEQSATYAREQAELAARVEREQAEAKAKAEEQARQGTEALAALVRQQGSTSQRERLGDATEGLGRLPRAEALDLARSVVFSDLAEAPRYERLTAANIPCEYEGEIEFEARDLEEVPEQAWERLTAICTAAPEGASVQLREHYGRCDCAADSDCPAAQWCSERLSVLVSLTWHGIELSREYAVPEPKA